MASSAKSKPNRVFGAFGSLDKKVRNWHYLPPVSRSCGESPRGEELLYRMNETTLEVGQGASSFRGFFGLAACVTLPAVAFVVSVGLLPFFDRDGPDPLGAWMAALMLCGLALLALSFVFFLVGAINDYFGFIDAPLRFDRTRSKVYIWASRKEGPLELDWDSIKPVAQSASAPPYQFNSFQSVLLVDEDKNGDVRFEGKLPRIAQIGGAVLDRAHTLAAYEFVRVFMERGPHALPAVEQHLVWRYGPRSFVDIFGFIKGSIRDWPRRPAHERKIGWLVVGILAMTIAAPMFWPLQLSQGVAQRTTRIPRWPERYERLAAEGGPLVPPAGSVPNDPPMLWHERAVASLWVGSALTVYALIAWKAFG